jgi:hypothetical protein
MASQPLQDFTEALYGKYNTGNLTASGLHNNLTAICSTVAVGTLSWVNEDCIILINNTGTTLYEGTIVSISPSNVVDGCILATGASDDFLCGVVYRGGEYQQPVVIAIQGEYPVLISTLRQPETVIGNVVVVSSTPGWGRVIGAQVGTINMIGVCAEKVIIPDPFETNILSVLVKCMIQNFQSI